MLAYCGSHGPRKFCWGGFSSTAGSAITDLAVFWPGIPEVEVTQRLPQAIVAPAVSELSASEQSHLISALQDSVITSFREDIQCQVKLSYPCG